MKDHKQQSQHTHTRSRGAAVSEVASDGIEGQSLSPPSIQFKASKGPIQREENEGAEQEGSSTDIDFSLLPPSVRFTFWRMMIQADTSSAGVSYSQGDLTAGLGYQYSGNIVGNFQFGDFRSNIGVNPTSGALSLGGSYGGFSLSGSADVGGSSYSLGLSYGAPMMPSYSSLSDSIYGAEAGIRGIGAGLPTAMDDPMGFYDSQSDNIDAVMQAYSLLNRVQSQQATGIQFGAGLRLSYNPVDRMFLMLSVQGQFEIPGL